MTGLLRSDALAPKGGSAAGLNLSGVYAPSRVLQRFEEHEHQKIGDEATEGPLGQVRTVQLAPDYSVTYGEMVAMAGDHFETIDQMRQMAAKPGRGAGTREELEYVRTVKINGNKAAAGGFSPEATKASEERYLQLASQNVSHFLAPGAGDQDRPLADRAGEVITTARLSKLFPFTRVELVRAPQNAVAAYHMNHARALVEAASAGKAGTPIDVALATEAFGNHYLTDSFSGGHVRTERRSAFDHWNERVPMFPYNLQGYLAERIAEHLSDSIGWFTEEGFYSGDSAPGEGTFAAIGDKLAAQGTPLTFGVVVAKAIHDYDNKMGVLAVVGGEQVKLYGDDRLGHGDEERLAVEAVRVSATEVEEAYRLGQAGVAPEGVPGSIQVPYVDGLFAAERLLQRAVPDNEQTVLADQTPSVPWNFENYADLLGNGLFREALKGFCAGQASRLNGLVKGERQEVQDAVTRITVRLGGDEAPEVVKEIIEWVPETGGGKFDADDTNAMIYVERAAATQGGLASLALPQRIKLIRFLFSGIKVWADEEDAAFRVLTAKPSDTQSVIEAVGWSELEDELGDRFSDAFPIL